MRAKTCERRRVVGFRRADGNMPPNLGRTDDNAALKGHSEHLCIKKTSVSYYCQFNSMVFVLNEHRRRLRSSATSSYTSVSHMSFATTYSPHLKMPDPGVLR